MRVILINPPHPYLVQPDAQAPLGLMYLAAVVRDQGSAVELVNLSGVAEVEALELIPSGADLYGFTATCVDYGLCERIAAQLKARELSTEIVIGGPVATVSPEVVNLHVFDSFCIGEGEYVIIDMLDAIQQLKSLDLAYKRERVASLDALPYPARDLMDTLGENVFVRGQRYFPQGQSTVISGSRGCPYSCAFCASKLVWHKHVTWRSPQSIADEVSYCIAEYGIREFRFGDDTLNLRSRWMEQLCDALGPLDIAWRGSVRAGLSGPHEFNLLAQAGCREISPGIESGDQRVLDTLNKNVLVKDNRELCEWASTAGINVRMLLMSGTPGECADTPEVNREWLQSVPYEAVALKQFRPIPGSPIWITPEAFGCRILNRDLEQYNFHLWRRGADGTSVAADVESVIETESLSKEALEDNIMRMREYALQTGKCNRG